jgi:hypothetical protein
LDKNEIAALLEALCERPFAGDPDGRPPAVASRAGRALSHADAGEEQSGSMAGGAEAGQAESPGRETAALASILSGTATDAQSQAFQAAAMTSGAVRLEAQSALAFVDGIEQTPLKAPAHLVEHVLASAAGAPSRSRPGIWSRLSGAPRGQVAAACVVMLMAGGLSWSLLLRPADLPAGHPIAPAATSPKAEPPISDIAPKPAPAPAFAPSPAPAFGPAPVPAFAPAPAPEFVPAPAFAPVPAPAAPVLAPAPSSPPLQALADPCEPRSFAASEVGARSNVEAKAAKPAPNRQPRTAAVSAPDPGCAVNGGTIEAGQNPQADQGPVRAAKPAAKVGRAERERPAAAATAPASAPSAGAARPASPALRPGLEQRR